MRDATPVIRNTVQPRSGRRATLLFLLATVAAFLLVPASAMAAPIPFLETFGSAAKPSFGTAEGMAVDQETGDLLVIDKEKGTVSRYHEDGTPSNFSALGSNVIDGKAGGADETPQKGLTFFGPSVVQVAVDRSGGATDGNIYVAQIGSSLIDIFSENGNFLGQLTESSEGPLSEPCGVAVDSSGNVYVGAAGNFKVDKYTPSGAFPVNADNTLSFPTGSEPCSIAAGAGPTAGSVFVNDFEGPVRKFNATTGAEDYVVLSGINITDTVDPSSGHVFVAGGTEFKEVIEIDASGASPTVVSSTPIPNIVFGVAVNGSTGNLYVARFGNSNVEVYAEATPEFELTVEVSGSGKVTSSPPGINCGSECTHKFKEGTLVKLTATPNEGGEFVEWTGDCSGSGACEVTMNEAHTVGAVFKAGSVPFEVEQIGSNGTVQCEDNGGGLTACASSYTFGHTIKVVATPESAEYVVGSLTGTGSAAGKCNAGTGICEFTITAATTVTVKFDSAGKKAETSGEVYGEVPATTSLVSGCESVNLGLFKPGITANYSNTCPLTLTSSGAATSLTASDGSAIHTGHLIQGSFFLPSALEAKATDSEAKGTGPGLTPLSPVTLLTFSEPVSNDAATLEFNQHIGEHDGLHTGKYAKTITLTLEQTSP